MLYHFSRHFLAMIRALGFQGHNNMSEQPWGMLDFVLYDPSGVLWRFGQNVQT